MALRFTPTLAVCLIGAGITGALLALPPADSNGASPVTVRAASGGSAPAPPRHDRDRRLLVRRIANRDGGCGRTGEQRRRNGAHPDGS